MGIVGGVIGLLLTPVYLLLLLAMLVIEALAQTSALTLIMVVFIIAAPMAILGIVGGILSRNRPQLGGLMMLTAGALPLLLGTGGFAFLAGQVGKLPSLAGGLLPFLVLYSWCFLLILAGLISLQSRTRVRPASP